MGSLLRIKINAEQRVSRLVNFYRRVKVFSSLSSDTKHCLEISAIRMKSNVSSRVALLAGNGPSFDQLKDYLVSLCAVDIFTSNHAFESSFFSELSPKFHFIIDPKIVSGEWNIDMVDRVLHASPQTIVVLDVRWRYLPALRRFLNHPNVCWILPVYFPSYYSDFSNLEFASGFHGLNVTSSAFSVSVCLGYQRIAFIGVESDGLFREILGRPSHFYNETSKDSAMSSYELMVQSLYLSVYSMQAWQGCVKSVSHSGVDVFNLSDQGIFDVCKRVPLQSFVDLISDVRRTS